MTQIITCYTKVEVDRAVALAKKFTLGELHTEGWKREAFIEGSGDTCFLAMSIKRGDFDFELRKLVASDYKSQYEF